MQSVVYFVGLFIPIPSMLLILLMFNLPAIVSWLVLCCQFSVESRSNANDDLPKVQEMIEVEQSNQTIDR